MDCLASSRISTGGALKVFATSMVVIAATALVASLFPSSAVAQQSDGGRHFDPVDAEPTEVEDTGPVSEPTNGEIAAGDSPATDPSDPPDLKDPTDLIVGGRPIPITEAPYQVLVLAKDSRGRERWICGGVIVRANVVLTAAHCVEPPASRFTIFAGDRDPFDQPRTGQIRQSKQVTIHPNYDSDLIANDLAVVTVAPFDFGPRIQPIAMGLPDQVRNAKSVTVTGWGVTQASGNGPDSLGRAGLKRISLAVRPDSACGSSTIFRPRTNLCLGGLSNRSDCQGDSGGPSVIATPDGPRLAGLVSFGPNDSCRGVTVHVELTAYRRWLLDTLPTRTCDGRAVTVDIGLAMKPTHGPDVIMGTRGADAIRGLRGHDRICGGAGNDRIEGGMGNDRIFGNKGTDRLFGNQGNDRLEGGLGVDHLDGNLGRDRCIGANDTKIRC